MIGYGKSLMSYPEALEWVIDRQRDFLGWRPGGKPPKYRIGGMQTEEGWQYWADLVPCPACNPSRYLAGHVAYFIRDTFGSAEWCKKHATFWADFSKRYEGMLVPASTKAVRFPSV